MRLGLVFSVAGLAACSDTSVKTVNSGPEAIIASHSTGDTVLEGDTETVIGQVGDADHALEDLSVTWLQDGETVCTDSAPDSTGNVLCPMTFAVGGGEISLMVRDPRGAADSASVNLDVQATDAPTAELLSPTADGIYYSDEAIAFEGLVSDTEDAPGDLTVRFETAALGDLELSVSVTTDGNVAASGMLAEGEHTVRIVAIDSSGKEGSNHATITVEPPNTDPTCTITAPVDGDTFNHGEPVVFEATVQDEEDPAEEVELSWESDVDGVFSTDGADATGAATVSADALSPGEHTVTLTATDTRGQTATDTVSFTLNQDPVIDGVTISPDPAYNDDTLVCNASATDGDGDTPTLSYEWTGGATGPELPLTSIIAASGDTLTCTATATDSAGSTAVGSASITLGNRAPTVAVSIDPAAPTHHDTLTCTASGMADPDDDATTLSLAWTIDGAPAVASASETESILEEALSAGQTVVCTATIDDGKGGTSTATDTVVIANTAPTVDSVTLSPSTVYTNDTITAAVTTSDEDGDAVTVAYAWYVDGSLVGESGSTLSGATYFDKDEAVHVVATPSDGFSTGDGLMSESITVLNTAPTAPSVSISPPEPSAGEDDLLCTIDAGSTDDDGDPVLYTITWTVDGTSFTDTLTTDRTGDTVPADETNGDEEWTCIVTPNDGTEDGPSAFATVTVQDCYDGWGSTETDLGDADYKFEGVSSDRAGFSVSGAGDVDGDGLHDILVGAPNYSDPSESGKVYLLLGASMGSSSTIDLATADYIFEGEGEDDEAGYSVAAAGDVDGDGLGDFLVGAYQNDDGGSNAGKAYLIFGASLGDGSTINLADAGYSFVGENSGDSAGRSVASAGDVDADGLDDILIGAFGNDDGGTHAGKTYLILSASLGSAATINLADADYGFIGENDRDRAGEAVASAGDVDADGLDDILIGAYNFGWDQTGKAYLILGSSLGSDSEIDLSLADYSFNGEHSHTYAGDSVSSAGDVDGDGLADILVGSDGYGPDAPSTGRTYVILGTSLGSTSEIDLADADYIFEGESSGDSLGESVSGAGDVDGDGLDDLLVGKFGNRGKAYLLLAASLDGSSTMDFSDADYSFVGESDADKAGYSVSTAGDVNGDGLPDIIIGAHGDGAGKAYLLLSPNTCNTPPRGTEVSIAPASPIAAEDDLVCTIDTEAFDAEGDAISYTFEWEVDGIAYEATDSTTHTGDTVPASATTEGEEWTCFVTPFDGTDNGPPAEATVTVIESADWVSSSTGLRMALIPAGTFEMGCTDEMDVDGDCSWYESPVHEVTITRDFLVGITEVTQDQWETVMGTTPSTATDCGPDCPVETISWTEAIEFVNELSALDGLDPAYSGDSEISWDRTANGYRLLTEAEWEFAARADDGTTYAGSDVAAEVAWYNDTADSSTQPVAGLLPNGNGLYDMSGNVFEWCWDWHSTDYYAASPSINPIGPDGPLVDHVERGGSYAYGTEHARISDRNRRDTPHSRWNFTGLRIARYAPGSTPVETGLEYTGDHGGAMIKIDAQTFDMGCTDGMSSCEVDENPVHSVTLSNDFYIGETEVTQGEFRAMTGWNPAFFIGCGLDCPMENVSWHEAAEFANALSDSEGLERCYTCTGSHTTASCEDEGDPYSCEGYRLPTEAEREAAARCGEDTLYAGSTVIDDVGWHTDNSGGTPHAVATKAPNACGLYDMSGNLHEWIQDWYSSSYYSISPDTDPPGPAAVDVFPSPHRVFRGGSWTSRAADSRVIFRDRDDPIFRGGYIGFRLVRVAP